MRPRRYRTAVALATLGAAACAAAPAMAGVSFSEPVDHAIGAPATVWAAVASVSGAERATVAVTAAGELILLHTDATGGVIATERTALPEGTNHSVALADVDADGTPEALVGRIGADSLAVFRRVGATLERGADIPTGTGPAAPVAGDLNGDGHLDLVTRIAGATPVTDAKFIRLMGDGAGGFGPAQTVATPQSLAAMLAGYRLGDLDADGDLDLVVSGLRPIPAHSGSVISALLNTGIGSFGPPSEPTGGILGGLADVTGDGRPDILISGEKGCLGAPGLRFCDDFAVKVQTVGAAEGNGATVGGRQQILAGVAQLDGAGPEDLILGGLPDGPQAAPPRSILPSLGGGTFGEPIPFLALEGSRLTPVDLNGDGATDLVAEPGSGAGTIAFFLSRGVTSGALEFGEVPAGTAAERQLEVRNEGAAPLPLGAPSIVGPAPDDFAVVENGCADTVLPADQSCTVKVRFRPGGAGLRTAQLQLAGTPEPRRFTLTGVGLGVPGPAAGAPQCGTVPTAPQPGEGGAVRLTVGQLRVNQRIGQAAIRRLNAVEAWLNAGVQGRDLCGGAIGGSKLAAGIATATALAPLAEPSAPDPRPVAIGRRSGRVAVIQVSAAQLRINQRIYQAAIRRADALEARMAGKLTGGDLAAGALGQDKLAARLRILAAAPAASEPARSRTQLAPREPGQAGEVVLTAAQLQINQRIAQAAVRRANTLVARLKAGLAGDAFADGSITARNLATGVVKP